MALGQVKRTFGPLALTATLTTNVYNNASALIYDVIKQIRVVNKTAAAHNFTLYLGATGANAAGTELAVAQNVPANSYVDVFFNPGMKMVSTDFLVGGADALTSLVIMGLGEQVVV